MARIEVTMPKMGESIMEGTVVEWSKKVGDAVEQDETLLEIATDKVDSEVPAPESGILVEILVEEGETVEVGEPIAIIETDADAAKDASKKSGSEEVSEDASDGDDDEVMDEEAGEEEGDKVEASKEADKEDAADEDEEDDDDEEEDDDDTDKRQKDSARSEQDDEEEVALKDADKDNASDSSSSSQNGTGASGKRSDSKKGSGKQAETVTDDGSPPQRKGSDGRFFTPLVRAIAKEEGISQEELESLEGSGNQGRVTKQDVLDYVNSGKAKKGRGAADDRAGLRKPGDAKDRQTIQTDEFDPRWPDQKVEIIKMDRMRKVISEHMIRSKQTSAHVTTYGEADVTRLVQYREKHKDKFQKENGFKLTFTPYFIEATIQAIREFPLINSSVDGDEIILKRSINYGVAVALGESGAGGLIVPVIKNAGEMNIQGLARKTHELAQKARSKQLSPDDLVGGTFTLTNYGSVGNLMGSPIINQPQVAIFGTGIIQKRPVVIEVDGTDTIAIRHMVYLSMSYDHRIIDGAMGGAFVQRVKQFLENFDVDRSL